MQSQILDRSLRVKFKIERGNENPICRPVNIVLIATCCLLAIIGVYYFFIAQFTKAIIYLVFLFFLLFVFLEIVNGFLNIEVVELKIMNTSFIVRRKSKIKTFDINKCKIEYHIDKTDWLQLDCENEKIIFSLAQKQTKELMHFVELMQKIIEKKLYCH
jgi:hypothetical protein